MTDSAKKAFDSPPPKKHTLSSYVRQYLRSLAATRNSIGARLLVGVLLFSGFVTLILTANQLYSGYRRDVAELDSRLGRIGRLYVESLAEGLWTLDERQLRLQLDGILQLPDIRGVEIREAGSADKVPLFKLSREPEDATFARDYPLHYSVQGQDRVIGSFRVEATHDGIYRRLVNTASTILVSQAATIFLVSLFIFYLFRHLVTRHLSAIAADIGSHRANDTPLKLHLRRRPSRHEDELERVVVAFNALSHNLHVAHRDLIEREARIRRLVDANIIGIFIWRLDGKILEANDAFLRLVGYDRDEVLSGRIRWTDLTAPEWQELDTQGVEELKRTGVRQPFEKEYLRKNGSRVPVLAGGALFDKGGHEGVAFVLDLTERKQAEEAARQSEYKLREAIETIPAMVWSTWPDGHADFFNRRWQQYTGLTLDQSSGWDWGATVHPEDAEHYFDTWKECIATGKPIETEVRFRRGADGEYRWFLDSGVPLRDEKGNILKWYGVVTDIHDRKQAEAALRESEEQWKAVFENNPVMYFMVGENGAILSVNPFGAEQLGYSVDELVGRPVTTVFYEPDREAVQRNAAACFGRPSQAMSWELRKIRKNGEMIWVRETARATLINNRLVLLIVCEDVTEGKRAAEALAEVQTGLAHANRVAALGQLTASIAHEVSQPIAGVLNSGQAALRWLDRQNLDAARRSIERIIRDSVRASDVVSGIRALVKKAPPRADSFDITKAARDVIVLTRDEAGKTGVSVETQFAEGLPLVRGDRVQIQQVILNLVINAMQAMSSVDQGPRKLKVKTAQSDEDFVSIAVEDSGPGLDLAMLDRAFEPFYTTKPDGLGMGLSICRSIVEAHGGILTVTANVPRGAIFRFTVPRKSTSHEL